MDVKYIGRANIRIIRDVDLLAQGIEGFTTTTWRKWETKTVQDAGGTWLVEHLPTEFVQVQPADPAPVAAEAKSTSSGSTRSTKNTSTES